MINLLDLDKKVIDRVFIKTIKIYQICFDRIYEFKEYFVLFLNKIMKKKFFLGFKRDFKNANLNQISYLDNPAFLDYSFCVFYELLLLKIYKI